MTFRLIQRGFTLIEMMVVIVIMGILASLIVPKIMGRPDEARIIAAKQDIASVNNVILLAGANTIVELNTYSDNIFGIETANPGSGYIHVIPKTYVGCTGALYLLEQILNGTKLLRAWN